jgi:hypothetical protein
MITALCCRCPQAGLAFDLMQRKCRPGSQCNFPNLPDIPQFARVLQCIAQVSGEACGMREADAVSSTIVLQVTPRAVSHVQ